MIWENLAVPAINSAHGLRASIAALMLGCALPVLAQDADEGVFETAFDDAFSEEADGKLPAPKEAPKAEIPEAVRHLAEGEIILAKDAAGTADERAAIMIAQMSQEEKLGLLMGFFGADFAPAKFEASPLARMGSAGYVPGIARLGIPAQWQADAGMGVATQGGAPEKRARTALPSGIAVAASFDPAIAFAGGAMIGSEARNDGFNVMLAGSVNLAREMRNGRNFEYVGEDPLLAGLIGGAKIAGIQSNDIISTAKHYALNAQETDRGNGNSIMDEGDMRMSDLLAFQIAFEKGQPGSAMCGYNRINGPHACEHPFLLNQVLRQDWDWPGYVMSDWGAAHSTAVAANAGLDQESGLGLQMAGWFKPERLTAALDSGELKQAQIDLMAGRILRTMFAHGLIDNPVDEGGEIDFAANRAISQHAAEAGIVLLKNEGDILPLAANVRRIAVIGGHADKGVLSGGGSSQVYPEGENAVPGLEPTGWPGPVVYYPSSPLEELRKALPLTEIRYIDGSDPVAAAALASKSDLAIIFGTQWASESIDVKMQLDGEQDALIAMVAETQPNSVVVLETGGPVLLPWADDVAGIIEAWYPGRMGGAAIANVLTGAVNPSGHLPMSFPKSLDQLPYPGEPRMGDVVYNEGAAAGYKWFDKQGHKPQFPFGHGLSYTHFTYSSLAVTNEEDGVFALIEVTNDGDAIGADAVQLYISGPGWEAPQRLGGFAKVDMEPGEKRALVIPIDPRLLSVWYDARPGWTRAAGAYRVSLGHSSRDLGPSVMIELGPDFLPADWKPTPLESP